MASTIVPQRIFVPSEDAFEYDRKYNERPPMGAYGIEYFRGDIVLASRRRLIVLLQKCLNHEDVSAELEADIENLLAKEAKFPNVGTGEKP